MLFFLSPSKTQEFVALLPKGLTELTQPAFLAQSKTLITALRKYDEAAIASLMDISPKLAALNVERYRAFRTPFTKDNARPCLLAFQGDVYDGLAAETLTPKQFTYAQDHLRILSGLYGLLRPFDLIQPYRLEMSIKLPTAKARDLYAFWGTKLAEALNQAAEAAGTDTIINLASEEYSSAVDRKVLKPRLISPQFKEEKGNQIRILALFAKRARGMMARHLIETEGKSAKALQSFSTAGYSYRPDLSTEDAPVFARKQPIAKAA